MSQLPRLAPAILRLLTTGYTGTTAQLAEKIHGHPTAVRRVMKELHGNKHVRIYDWARQYHNWVQVWCLADGRQDEPKPKPIPSEEKSRRYRDKNRDRVNMRRRTRPGTGGVGSR